MKLNPKAFGLAVGTVKGLAIFLATVFTASMQGGETLQKLNRFYWGYEVSFQGAFIGLVYGFIDGFVLAFLVSTLYNIFAKEK